MDSYLACLKVGTPCSYIIHTFSFYITQLNLELCDNSEFKHTNNFLAQ
uniref:Uncharacterized protein n=1 Tax=Setaria italica TaxID=4555 RepID=K3ZFR4_SETIT